MGSLKCKIFEFAKLPRKNKGPDLKEITSCYLIKMSPMNQFIDKERKY